jgi:hypothetical protein
MWSNVPLWLWFAFPKWLVILSIFLLKKKVNTFYSPILWVLEKGKLYPCRKELNSPCEKSPEGWSLAGVWDSDFSCNHPNGRVAPQATAVCISVMLVLTTCLPSGRLELPTCQHHRASFINFWTFAYLHWWNVSVLAHGSVRTFINFCWVVESFLKIGFGKVFSYFMGCPFGLEIMVPWYSLCILRYFFRFYKNN